MEEESVTGRVILHLLGWCAMEQTFFYDTLWDCSSHRPTSFKTKSNMISAICETISGQMECIKPAIVCYQVNKINKDFYKIND